MIESYRIKINKKSDKYFSPTELRAGIKHEMEHTDDKEIAKSIAKDHLQEIPDYYTLLEEMERTAHINAGRVKYILKGII